MKRTALTRRTTLNPVSERQRQYDREFKKASRTVKARSRGVCEAQVARDCYLQASHVHHALRRSQGGSNDPSNLFHLCRPCHEWIHSYPTQSYEAGWLIRSGV